MSDFSRLDKIKHKIGEKTNPYLAPFRRKKLNNLDFTIISNNCWGGVCYEYYGLQKQSPTVGMYFFADEYIRFLSDLRGYLGQELKIVSANESKYREELFKRGQSNVLVGKLGDIEITLLHYRDKDIAIEKWKRRVQRINWDNLIIKFSYMNMCEDYHIDEFERKVTEYKKSQNESARIRSFVFVPWEDTKYKDAYYIKPDINGQISNDTFFWNKYCNVEKIINGIS